MRVLPASFLWSLITDDAGRPTVLIAWIECESCGRIDKAAHDFNYPADMAAGIELFAWVPWRSCT